MEPKLYNPLQVITNALNVNVEYVPSVFGKESNQHQEHPEGETDFTQATDSNLEATDHWGCSACSNAPNDDDLIFDCDLNLVEKAVKTGIHLNNTDAQTGTNAKHCAYHREDVYCISHPTIDLFTNERIEASAHGHGKAFSVTHKGEEKTNNNVHDPTVDAPVKQGNIHCVLSKLIVAISIKHRACTWSMHSKSCNADAVNNLQEESKFKTGFIYVIKNKNQL